MSKLTRVSAAILVYRQASGNNLICLAQRSTRGSHGGWWEFPGGKVETWETPEEALKRELFEELHLSINTSKKISTELVNDLEIHFFVVESDQLISSSSAHDKVLWLDKYQLIDFLYSQNSQKILPADISILKKLINGTINLTS